MFVFNTAFDAEQRAGARFQPETPNPSQPRKMGCTLGRQAVFVSASQVFHPELACMDVVECTDNRPVGQASISSGYRTSSSHTSDQA